MKLIKIRALIRNKRVNNKILNPNNDIKDKYCVLLFILVNLIFNHFYVYEYNFEATINIDSFLVSNNLF